MDGALHSLLGIAEVAWINILLSGDNAVVIALACRSLPARQRQLGIITGSAAAIVLRIGFAVAVSWLLAVPWLKLVGGLLLLWIAISLARSPTGEDPDIDGKPHFWRAVGTIAVADAAMSLDNVIAIAAVANGQQWLFVLGLLLSIPLVVAGATLISKLLARYPVIVWAGAALLGWVAGGMIAEERALPSHWPAGLAIPSHAALSVAGAVLVVAVAGLWRALGRRGH